MAYNPNIYCGRCGCKLQQGEERYSLQYRPGTSTGTTAKYVKTFCIPCGEALIAENDTQPGEAAERSQLLDAARRLGGNGQAEA